MSDCWSVICELELAVCEGVFEAHPAKTNNERQNTYLNDFNDFIDVNRMMKILDKDL